MIFANVTEDDILLRDELEKINEGFSNVKITYTIDKVSVSQQSCFLYESDVATLSVHPTGLARLALSTRR